MIDYTGKVALVTGAASGMGRAIATAFAASAARVTVADINASDGRETVATITAAGGTAQFVSTDVSDAESVAAMVAATVSAYGSLECAVNAAAIEGENVPLDELPDERFDLIQAVNVRSVFLCMKHELKAMLATGRGGAIVNIGSTNSFRPQHQQTAYTTAKHAVLGMTKAAAIDYARHDIRINAICPGAIDTPMLRNAIERRGGNEAGVLSRLTLTGRFGRPDEIAKAALWLCSDDASFTLGHALAVDGGYLAR